jgi:hypothetical protein
MGRAAWIDTGCAMVDAVVDAPLDEHASTETDATATIAERHRRRTREKRWSGGCVVMNAQWEHTRTSMGRATSPGHPSIYRFR